MKMTCIFKQLVVVGLFSFASLAFSKDAPMVGITFDSLPCSQYRAKGFGPFDYTMRRAYQHELYLVESFHFNKNVENLIKGTTNASPYGDIDYTLRAFPNHHRALLTMIRYQSRIDSGDVSSHANKPTPAECYFQRAMAYSPKDAATRSLYAYFLTKKKKFGQAEKTYISALNISPNNSKIAYSYGLFLIKIKKNKRALEIAKQAYKNGNPPPGLRNKLIKLGVWE